MKICSRCKEDKSTALFTKNKNSKDGLSSWCKQCKKLSDKRYVHLPGGGKHDVADKITEEIFKDRPKQRDTKNNKTVKKRGRHPSKKLSPEELKEYFRMQGKKHEHSRRVRKYGITVEQHLEQLKLQAYKCAICPVEVNISSPIDHCHTTLETRGILCRDCNLALGLFKDNPENLISAVRYLSHSVGLDPEISKKIVAYIQW